MQEQLHASKAANLEHAREQILQIGYSPTCSRARSRASSGTL
jgi:hypothetical protein